MEFDLEGRKIILSIVEYFKDKENEWKEYEAAHVPKKMPKIEKTESTETVEAEEQTTEA